MLLHTKIPQENQTYLEKLQLTLKTSDPAVLFKFYDTEEIFVEEIAKRQRELQNKLLMYKTYYTLKDPELQRYIKKYENKLEEIQTQILYFEDKIKTRPYVKYLHKKNVLESLLDYFKNKDGASLIKALNENPEYSASSSRSETARLVKKSIKYYNFLVENYGIEHKKSGSDNASKFSP